MLRGGKKRVMLATFPLCCLARRQGRSVRGCSVSRKESQSGFGQAWGEAIFLQESHLFEHLTLLVIIIFVGTATEEP